MMKYLHQKMKFIELQAIVMNKEEIDKWLDNEYGVSYTRLEELHDFYFEKYCDLKEENQQLKEINEEHKKLNGELREENKKYKEVIDKLKDKTKENIKNAKYEITTLTIGDKAYYQYIEKMLDNYVDILKGVDND